MGQSISAWGYKIKPRISAPGYLTVVYQQLKLRHSWGEFPQFFRPARNRPGRLIPAGSFHAHATQSTQVRAAWRKITRAVWTVAGQLRYGCHRWVWKSSGEAGSIRVLTATPSRLRANSGEGNATIMRGSSVIVLGRYGVMRKLCPALPSDPPGLPDIAKTTDRNAAPCRLKFFKKGARKENHDELATTVSVPGRDQD